MTSHASRLTVFMATSRSGLGHLRRAASLARAMTERRPDVRLELYTNAEAAGLTEGDLSAFSAVRIMAKADMAAHAVLAGAAVAVADTMVPDGIANIPVKRILVLRETPDDRLARFSLPGADRWDLLLLPNPADHWMPATADDLADRVVPTGWIYRRPETIAPPRRDRPLLLVATGGGGTIDTAVPLAAQLDDVVAALQRLVPGQVEVVQALGPRAPEGAALRNVDRVIDPGGDLNEWFAGADAAISTAGYNSILELAITTTPALLMTIARTFDDQTRRAIEWGPRLGRAHVDGNPGAAAAWLASNLLTRQRRLAVDIGPSGATVAARAILDLLP